MYQFEKPDIDDWFTPQNYYQPTIHLAERYRKRMGEHTAKNIIQKRLKLASNDELGMRANYMLLFSIHGRSGGTPETEVRYYFDWEIVVDNKNKTIITMYQDRRRSKLPVSLFGDPKFRRLVYKSWFMKKSSEEEQK